MFYFPHLMGAQQYIYHYYHNKTIKLRTPYVHCAQCSYTVCITHNTLSTHTHTTEVYSISGEHLHMNFKFSFFLYFKHSKNVETTIASKHWVQKSFLLLYFFETYVLNYDLQIEWRGEVDFYLLTGLLDFTTFAFRS